MDAWTTQCAQPVSIAARLVVFVGINAWPIFEHNGLSWLGSGGDLGRQLADMQNKAGKKKAKGTEQIQVHRREVSAATT